MAYAFSPLLLQLDMISSANDETERSKSVQEEQKKTHTKYTVQSNEVTKIKMTGMKSVSDECAIIPKKS